MLSQRQNSNMTGGISQLPETLQNFSRNKFDVKAIEEFAGLAVAARFKQSLIDGSKTSKEDILAIESALFQWCSLHNCIHYAHWFFPLRTGGSRNSSAGMKYDLFLSPDYENSSNQMTYKAMMPSGTLFRGETDGSSFPNGGLRATHRAAAFTSWDRSSPPFVHDNTCYVPCALISQMGCALDEKTPLLRAMDAVNREGLAMLKAIGGYDDVNQVMPYLGWEQEFFIISKAAYLKRPDLRACGRTLMGAPPVLGQQGDVNYFGVVPSTVKACLEDCQAVMLKLGCPMITYHNEVAPGQHEICPIYTLANVSADLNQIAMQICGEVAAKHGLVFLFHEKPFAGVNGSGKHNNWSVGTNAGHNFFNPGSNEKQNELFMAAVACFAYGLNQHNSVARQSIATAGNDHRLGAQEAPPAIVSLYTGQAMEAHIKSIIAGGPITGYQFGGKDIDTGCSLLNDLKAGVEDRNRTASMPFCGNRFEFRGVGSEQNCSLPMTMLNTIFADGMNTMTKLLEAGKSLRDAVAQMFEENLRVIFCGNGYSDEWIAEAAKRGLPNLKNSVEASSAFNSDSNKALFKRMGIYTDEEVDARAECMFENYVHTIVTEASCMIDMVNTGVDAAVAADLSIYASNKESNSFKKRNDCYNKISPAHDNLQSVLAKMPHGGSEKESAEYCLNMILPAMNELRATCDSAEHLVRKDLWPFPSYTDCCFGHHYNEKHAI
jgi:glutamine synthetase